MSNAFNKIINDSIIDMYNNNVANLDGSTYNNNRNELMLAQIAKEKIGEYFNDNNVIQNGDTDLTDLKHIFEYDTALQKRLYNLQKERDQSILSGRYAQAAKATEKSNEIKRFEDVGRLIAAQNNGANAKEEIINHYANGQDNNSKKHANLINSLLEYGSNEKTPNTKYTLWISDYDDVCIPCKGNNYKLFSIDEEVFKHPNCRCKQLYFDEYPGQAKSYLIVIFSGINTEKNDPLMLDLGEQLNQELLNRNSQNTVDIEQIAPYANDNGYLAGTSKVLQHASSTTEEVNRFTDQVIAKYNSGKYDLVIFIGYSGGGVMASRVAENINYRVPVDKIIRIGSPDLHVNRNDYAKKTYDISIPRDDIAALEFFRTNADNIYIRDEILTGYVIKNYNYHSSYFTQDRDEYGISNLEKTVDAILGQLK